MKVLEIIGSKNKREFVDEDAVVHDMPHPNEVIDKKDVLHNWTAKYRQKVKESIIVDEAVNYLKRDYEILLHKTAVDLTSATDQQVRKGLLTSAGFEVILQSAALYAGYAVGVSVLGKVSIVMSSYIILNLGTVWIRKPIYYKIFKQ